MIIDFHTHAFPPWLIRRREDFLAKDATFAEMFSGPAGKMATADRLARRMDEDGVDVSVVMGMGWADYDLARACNDYLIESAARRPDRLIALASVNPAWDGDLAAQEARRCAEEGALGIGELHPATQGFDLGDPDAMAPLMGVARDMGLFVVTHVSELLGRSYPGRGTVGAEVAHRFIRNFPDVPIVCAHWGGGLPFYALMPDVADDLRNAYVDTAATTLLYDAGVFDVAPRAMGVERVLLGSDYPLVRAWRALEQLESSLLPPDAKRKIAGGNAARLLGLQPAAVTDAS